MRSILLLLLISVCSFGTAQTVEEELESIRTQNDIIGMAVGASCDGSSLIEYYGGEADINSGQLIGSGTHFRVASISKTFTATGLMKLYGQGLFELDEDISEALGYMVRNPNFSDTPITYRMLLSHTSSLQDGSGYNSFLANTYNSEEPPAISDLILPGGNFFTSNIWRLEEPGTYFAYSNLNFGLIGTLIEKLSGQRFDVFMETEILQQLGIEGGFNLNTLESIDSLSVLYRDAVPQADNFGGVNPPSSISENYIPGTNGLKFAPQGGLRCTLKDLIALGEMLSQGGIYQGEEILPQESVDIMLDEAWNYNGENGDDYFGLFRNWGLGVHRSEGSAGFDLILDNTLMIGHPGEAYGLISDLYIEPNTGFVLAFISNGYLQGGSYSFGINSMFYLPEEEVFELLATEVYPSCQALSSGITEELISGCHLMPNDLLKREIYSMTGAQIFSSHSDFEPVSLPPGVYIEKSIGKEKTCVRKILRSLN